MDKEIRLGRFDKWGYKNSFSKGELSREFTYMNRDYDKLEQQVKEQKEVIDKAIEYINKYQSIEAYYEYIDEDGYDEYNYDEDFKKELLDLLKEVSE